MRSAMASVNAATAPLPRSSSEEDYTDAYDDGVPGLLDALKIADSETRTSIAGGGCTPAAAEPQAAKDRPPSASKQVTSRRLATGMVNTARGLYFCSIIPNNTCILA